MAFCKNCGQQLADGTAFCQNCGTPVEAEPQQAAPQQMAPQQAAPQQAAPVADQDVQENKGIAWLSYFGILLLIPMLARKASDFCKFHVKQGATLFCLELAYTIVTQILLAIINAIFPGHWTIFYVFVHSGVYNVFNVLFLLGDIFLFVLAIIGIVNAAGGKKQELPVIGKIDWIAKFLDKVYYNK